jgi:putative ATP-dependent endonuclease of the OLD family
MGQSMRLLSVGVNNYKGIHGDIENNTIQFDTSSAIFIFGQNNVGKSTFLHAYEAFYDDNVNSEDFTYGSENDIIVELALKIIENEDRERIDLGTGNKFDNLKKKYLENDILKLRKTWKYSENGKTSFNETYNFQDNKWEDIGYGGVGLHPAFQALMIKPLFIQAMPTETQVEKIVNEVLREAATKKLSNAQSKELKEAEAKITALQEIAYSKDTIDAYREKVNQKFKTLFSSYEVSIDDGTSKLKYTHDKLGKDFKIGFNQLSTNTPSSYMQMGHGAVRMAIFLLMLMRDELRDEGLASKNFLVLFEEPELFLHPALTKKLRNLIYEVSGNNMPFQIICASHSPQMIDISREHTSLVRMIKAADGKTNLFQVSKEDLTNEAQKTKDEVRQKIYEVLRFDPFVCESFYADEVVLVEGDTEAIVWRGYEQEFGLNNKEIFLVNCHTGNNIPFYQKLFSKFNIPYSVIADTDHRLASEPETTNKNGWDGKIEAPTFDSHIQKTISDQFIEDEKNGRAKYFLVFPMTFEPCHTNLSPALALDDSGGEGKPFKADRYWKKLSQNKEEQGFVDVPIIKSIRTVLEEIIEPA